MTTQNIYIQQGATFIYNIALNNANGQPLDVTGYSANAALKHDIYSANGIPVIFETMLANGSLTLRLEANVTSNLWPGTWFYDAIVTNGTNTYRVSEGEADVDAGITGITLFANT